MLTASDINDHLRIKWGYDLNGLQRFRVVFSDHEKELDGVTPKYSYISERWLLEKFIPEMQEYCCIWTFSINGQYVFPQIEWCDQLCYIAMADPKDKKKDLQAMEKEDIAKFISTAEAYLGEDSGGGVHEFKNQYVNFVKPVFLNMDFEINQNKKRNGK